MRDRVQRRPCNPRCVPAHGRRTGCMCYCSAATEASLTEASPEPPATTTATAHTCAGIMADPPGCSGNHTSTSNTIPSMTTQQPPASLWRVMSAQRCIRILTREGSSRDAMRYFLLLHTTYYYIGIEQRDAMRRESEQAPCLTAPERTTPYHTLPYRTWPHITNRYLLLTTTYYYIALQLLLTTTYCYLLLLTTIYYYCLLTTHYYLLPFTSSYYVLLLTTTTAYYCLLLLTTTYFCLLPLTTTYY